MKKILIAPLSFLTFGLLTAATHAQRTPTPPALEAGDVISVALASDAVVTTDVPDSFVGFGLFYSNLSSLVGRNTERFNPHFPAFMERLAQYQGTVPIRVGGGSVSETWFNPGDEPTPPNIDFEIDDDLLDSLDLLLDTTGSQALFGLNASIAEPTLFEDMANGILDHIDEEQIIAFELGNEPNRYVANGRRPEGYDFDIMLLETDGFLDRFETLVNTTKPIVGPTLTLFRSTVAQDPDWTAQLSEYIEEHGSRLGAISQNRYPSSDCSTNPNSSRFASIENLLDDVSSIGQAALFTDLIDDANDEGLPFWVHEHNTASCGGKDDVSDSFASALWFLDSTFAWLAEGVENVYVPFIRGGHYAPFLSLEDFDNLGTWDSEVFPMFYGMELFAQTAGTDRVLIESGQLTNSNVRAWVTRDEDGFSYVLLVNKDLDDSGNAKVLLPGSSENATVVRLQAPAASSKSGITLGGLTWDGVTGPVPAGTPSNETVAPDSEGLYQLALPKASAVLLTIPPADTSGMVIARPDAPSTAMSGQTLLLEGGDSFGDNLSFEWKQISGPELDITSSEEELAATTFPEPGSYTLRLTVSDEEGASDSENFTVFVLEPSQNSVFLENNGTFAFEAEDYASTSRGSGNFVDHEWVQDTANDASGGLFMRMSPSEGARDRSAADAPALEFPLRFETPGVWSVQVRMQGPDSDSDSLHIGFQTPTTSPNGIRQRDPEWTWTGEVPGEGQATVVVPRAGEVIFRVWPREDGVWIDQISLSLDEDADFASIPDSPVISTAEPEQIAAEIVLNPIVTLSFSTVADSRYLIEGSDTLESGDWEIVAIEEASGPLLTVPMEESSETQIQKFFRVRELP